MGFIRVIKERLTKQTPRWLVFLIDVYFSAVAFFLAYAIVWRFDWRNGLATSTILVVTLLLTYPFSYLLFKSYRGIIRHTGLSDVVNVLKATSFALISSTLILSFSGDIFSDQTFVMLVIHYLVTTTSLIFLRILYKRLYIQFIHPHNTKQKHLVIYGAGTSGIITNNALQADSNYSYNVLAFIDDNPKLHGSRINGIKVISPYKVTKEWLAKEKVEEIIISIQNIPSKDLNKIISYYEGYPVKLKIVPPVNSWINGDLEVQQIKEVKIEDLLGRKPIKLEKDSIRDEVKGKVVLVTGAAGSIGSEISRQLFNYPCKQVILVDQAESALYELQQNSSGLINRNEIEVEFVIGDIRDFRRVDTIFNIFKPDIVFHAAAYKHVPLMEQNPYEAVMTNIKGTKHVVDAADRYQVGKFVMISTDKAVNPTNVMGASKRVAELYVNYLTKQGSKTSYVVTRFGNVLGSNGSVIPLFKHQIAEGGPVTVTHPEVTRYFMTIPEACQLVLEAGAMAKGGEIYVFDMGDSMRIMDLAKRMIQLSGLQYPNDMDIEIVGLRPGEKIYEELLADGENTRPTHHEKIMIAKVRENNIANFIEIIEELTNCPSQDTQLNLNLELVGIIKKLVPEFKSQNSIFETIDNEDKGLEIK